MRRFAGDRLLIATHNAGKMAEMRALFAPLGVPLVSAAELGLPEPEETESTFVGNARIKAHAAAKASGLPALGDDSGLEVEALDGAPGVYTANWAEVDGQRDFGHAMRRTQQALVECDALQPWQARFLCTLVLAWPDGADAVFEGTANGQLIWPIRGREGHGYDPMFQPDGFQVTFAEMTDSEKNAISHRARAFEQLIQNCFT